MADERGERRYNYGFLVEEDPGKDEVRLTAWSSQYGILPLASLILPRGVIAEVSPEGEPVEVRGETVRISVVRFTDSGAIDLQSVFDQLVIQAVNALEESPERRLDLAPEAMPARDWCGWNWIR